MLSLLLVSLISFLLLPSDFHTTSLFSPSFSLVITQQKTYIHTLKHQRTTTAAHHSPPPSSFLDPFP
ncbi:hypothetical protein L6452_21129 [Arctium lappa]|uniref:Uncharacterized protein n=1 Tax=Arctium lappa TaxID=4217 RepID=A0ACB9BD96_ARCLA|nr:hypothetical protein L6452_21129 [Arctium lappa]